MTLNSSEAHPKQMIQLISSIASAPSAPAALESFDATHVMSSSMKSRGAVSGTYSYSLKTAHMGFSAWGNHVSGCFSRITSANGRPVLMR